MTSLILFGCGRCRESDVLLNFDVDKARNEGTFSLDAKLSDGSVHPMNVVDLLPSGGLCPSSASMLSSAKGMEERLVVYIQSSLHQATKYKLKF